jgi:hypothetical protein
MRLLKQVGNAYADEPDRSQAAKADGIQVAIQTIAELR